MSKPRVLLTAIGCPGGPSVARALRQDFYVVGVDMDARASGRYFVDAFYQVPAGDDPKFIEAIKEIAAREDINAILPESSNEVLALATFRDLFERELGVKVLVSSPEAVSVALDKAETYRAMQGAGVPMPEVYEVDHPSALRAVLLRMGYYEHRVVIKSPLGKGGRGLRIVVPELDRLESSLRQWPNVKMITPAELDAWMDTQTSFPRLIVMEYLPEDQDRADTYDGYGATMGYTKVRRDCRHGVYHDHETLYDPELMDKARRVVERLGLEYFVNVQFMGGKLLEVNPRISTCIYHEGFNLPALGVKMALGQLTEAKVTLPDGIRSQYYLDLRSYGG